MKSVADQLPRLGKRKLISLLSFTFNYVVSVRRGFLLLWELGMDCVILLWHSLSRPYNCFTLELTCSGRSLSMQERELDRNLSPAGRQRRLEPHLS